MKILGLFLLFFLFVGIADADSLNTAPGEKDASVNTFAGPIRLYQQTLSAADGDRCPMTPSCSAYAMEATKKHGFIMGWIMTCDRLLRCGRDEVNHCSPKKTPSGIRCSDPVENNDFWWK